MSTREAGLWNWLSGARKFYGKRLDMHRIENSLDSGTPDVEGCLSGESFWIELKSVGLPVKSTTPFNHTLTQDQISWIHQRTVAGGCACVILKVENLKLLLPGINILKAQTPMPFQDFLTYCEDLSHENPQTTINRVLSSVLRVS